MSEFSDNMSGSWDVAKRVFGAIQITVNGVTVDVIEHDIAFTSLVAMDRPGRQDEITGQLVVSRADWLRTGAGKGARFIYGAVDLRVSNQPLASQAGDIVVLHVTQA